MKSAAVAGSRIKKSTIISGTIDGSSPNPTSNKQRAERFIELGYGGRTMFYDCLKYFRYYNTAKADDSPPLKLSDFE